MGIFDKVTKPFTSYLTGGDTVNLSEARPDAGMDEIMRDRANQNTLDPIGAASSAAATSMLEAKPLYDAGGSYSTNALPQSIQAAIKARGEKAYSSDMDQLKKNLRAGSFELASGQQQSSFDMMKQKNAMDQGAAMRRAAYDQERSAIRKGLIDNLLGTAGRIGGMVAGGIAGGPMGAMKGSEMGGAIGGSLTGGASSTSMNQMGRMNQMSNIG